MIGACMITLWGFFLRLACFAKRNFVTNTWNHVSSDPFVIVACAP